MTGDDIKRIRSKLNMNISQFSEHVGVHWTTVSRWENGHQQVSNAYVKLLQQEESYLDRTAKRREKATANT
jgi:DNA-binding transcriptional regulator YiaG